MVYHLGSPNGGFISKYYPSPEDVHHAPENTAAMCTAFRRWGVYPIPAFSSISNFVVFAARSASKTTI
jgi:hypothetical protein